MGRKLNKRNLKALLRVLGKNSIQTINCDGAYTIYDKDVMGDIGKATWLDRCVLFFLYSYEYAQMDKNGGINLHMRSLIQTWELFFVYICIVIIGYLL